MARRSRTHPGRDERQVNELEALQRTHRLEELGFVVRSRELEQAAKAMVEFHERGGNRAMRRAKAKAARRKRR
jgi:hypothetical protein